MAGIGRSQRVVLDYNRLSLMIIISVLAYNELIVYLKSYSAWPDLELNQGTPHLIKILFVADPQIQGAHDSQFPILGSIKRWDSDRYLSKTFSWALYAYQPHVVVFLGDLIDEGSECQDQEYAEYAKRFKDIYDTKAVKVYVAGDNDIGGEGSDPVTQQKIERFVRHFPSRDVFTFQWNDDKLSQRYDTSLDKESDLKHPLIEIIPANLLTFKSPDKDWLNIDVEKSDQTKFRIVVSHLPILPTPNPSFSRDVMKKLKPSVIFSAHDHRGLDYSTSRVLNMTSRLASAGNITFFTQYAYEDDGQRFLTVQSNDFIHEVIVPTCSYRMGVREMAFGLAAINLEVPSEEKIIYVNLWLPSRFPLLYVYLAALALSSTLALIGRIKGRRSRRPSIPTPKRRNSSPSPHYSKLV